MHLFLMKSKRYQFNINTLQTQEAEKSMTQQSSSQYLTQEAPSPPSVCQHSVGPLRQDSELGSGNCHQQREVSLTPEILVCRWGVERWEDTLKWDASFNALDYSRWLWSVESVWKRWKCGGNNMHYFLLCGGGPAGFALHGVLNYVHVIHNE